MPNIDWGDLASGAFGGLTRYGQAALPIYNAYGYKQYTPNNPIYGDEGKPTTLGDTLLKQQEYGYWNPTEQRQTLGDIAKYSANVAQNETADIRGRAEAAGFGGSIATNRLLSKPAFDANASMGNTRYNLADINARARSAATTNIGNELSAYSDASLKQNIVNATQHTKAVTDLVAALDTIGSQAIKDAGVKDDIDEAKALLANAGVGKVAVGEYDQETGTEAVVDESTMGSIMGILRGIPSYAWDIILATVPGASVLLYEVLNGEEIETPANPLVTKGGEPTDLSNALNKQATEGIYSPSTKLKMMSETGRTLGKEQQENALAARGAVQSSGMGTSMVGVGAGVVPAQKTMAGLSDAAFGLEKTNAEKMAEAKTLIGEIENQYANALDLRDVMEANRKGQNVAALLSQISNSITSGLRDINQKELDDLTEQIKGLSGDSTDDGSGGDGDSEPEYGTLEWYKLHPGVRPVSWDDPELDIGNYTPEYAPVEVDLPSGDIPDLPSGDIPEWTPPDEFNGITLKLPDGDMSAGDFFGNLMKGGSDIVKGLNDFFAKGLLPDAGLSLDTMLSVLKLSKKYSKELGIDDVQLSAISDMAGFAMGIRALNEGGIAGVLSLPFEIGNFVFGSILFNDEVEKRYDKYWKSEQFGYGDGVQAVAGITSALVSSPLYVDGTNVPLGLYFMEDPSKTIPAYFDIINGMEYGHTPGHNVLGQPIDTGNLQSKSGVLDYIAAGYGVRNFYRSRTSGEVPDAQIGGDGAKPTYQEKMTMEEFAALGRKDPEFLRYQEAVNQYIEDAANLKPAYKKLYLDVLSNYVKTGVGDISSAYADAVSGAKEAEVDTMPSPIASSPDNSNYKQELSEIEYRALPAEDKARYRVVMQRDGLTGRRPTYILLPTR